MDFISTTSKVERIKQFQAVEYIPDLTPEEIQEIEQAGSRLHRRQYMRHVSKINVYTLLYGIFLCLRSAEPTFNLEIVNGGVYTTLSSRQLLSMKCADKGS
jgi:hypothetical protein